MNTKLRFFLIPLIVGLLFSFFPVNDVAAQATDFELTSVTGIWTATQGGSDIVGLNTNEVRWGRPAESNKSGMRFTGSEDVVFDEGEVFHLGTLTHLNYPVRSGTAASGATLQITLTFQNPAVSPDPTFTFDFDIFETSNTEGHCEAFQQSATPCDDRITFPQELGLESFTIGDKYYTLKIQGFVDDPNSSSPLAYFITEEYRESSAYLIATLSSVLVDDPDITLTKKTNDIDVPGEPGPELIVGEQVTWQYIVQNTGYVDLTDVQVNDSEVGVITCTEATLAAGESMTCTATGTVEAGQYHNTATVTADHSEGSIDASDESWYFGIEPNIGLTKTADPSSFTAVDDVIEYTFVAKNTGNVTLTDVKIDDTGLIGLYDWNCDQTGTVDLAPTEELTCTAKYKVTQADIDAGEVVNTAEASGQPPSGERIDDDDSETVDGPVINPYIALTKTATPTTYSAVGDVITFTFVATNTGNVTLTDVTIADPLEGLSGLTCGTNLTLAPDDTLTCTATYSITQADLSNGSVVNTATASGQPPSGERVEDEDSAEVKKAAIALTKTADVPTYIAVGDVITYTFVAENTGNVELTTVTITDTMSGLSGLDCGSVSLPTILTPGASVTCTATYSVTQADMDADKIDNTARVTGEDPADNEISAEDSETVDKIAISLTKTADPEVFTQVGEIITYSFVIENTGNLTLYNVTITDALPGLSELDCGSTTLPTFLGPDATITCTATYQITQSDMDRGFVENTASATGKDESGQSVDDDDEALVEGPKEGASIALVKSVYPEIYVAVNDTITYTFTATNDGPFSLMNVTIEDPLPGLSALSCSKTLPTSLQPGESVTCEATYSITQDDVDNGVINNIAVATGLGLNEEVVDDDDNAVVEGPKEEASIYLDKRVEPATYYAVGDEIVYSFVVTNNGIFSLYDVTVTDPLFSLSFGPIDMLEPGESKTYKYTYTVTQADLDARSIYNVATAMAYDPEENPISSTDNEIVERPEPKKVESLPTTGFAPNQITSLPPQSLDKSYTAYSDFWLEIPSLGVSVEILGVPKSNYGWDVTWLDDSAGWLNGTAFPTWPGNSIVTAHVWDAFDQAGPFVDLNELQWGDEVIVHLNGASYVFEVRSKHTIQPDDMSLVEREDEYAWLNLLTCRDFDEESDVYQYRLIVRAVLVDFE